MPKTRTRRVKRAFDYDVMRRVFEMDEEDFGAAYDMKMVEIPHAISSWCQDENYYFYKDNGSDILAVAHLDTVVRRDQRLTGFVETASGPVVYSGALDDRLGAYIILELLPKMGIQHDILLTVGEESGCSTAEHFETTKEYNWVIEFDRGGTDVVMYEYETKHLANMVRASGARVGQGIFTDICYLQHLGCKAINWGVGYRDYHGPRSHAFLDETAMMVGHYLRFHEANQATFLPHEPVYDKYAWIGGSQWQGTQVGGWRDSISPESWEDNEPTLSVNGKGQTEVLDNRGEDLSEWTDADQEDLDDAVIMDPTIDEMKQALGLTRASDLPVAEAQ